MEQFKISRAIGLSFRSWFRNFIPFTLLGAVLYSPVVLWFLLVTPDPGSDAAEWVEKLFTRPVYLVVAVSTLVAPLITYRVIQELDGRKVSLVTSMRFGLRGVLPALFLAVFTNLVQMIPGGGIASAIVTCVYFVVTPVAVAERTGPLSAFSRAAELTRGRRWGIFGLTFLLGLIMVAALAVWIVPTIASGDATPSSLLTSSRFFMLIMALFHMLTGIVQAVSYALLRQDKDGVSHAELAQIFG